MRVTIHEIVEHPIFQALNPQGKQFLEARRLPKRLNRFAQYGIEIAALIAFKTFPHIKTVPVVQMMFDDFTNGLYRDKRRIWVPSSGNTAYAVARLAPVFGFEETVVVLSTDVPDSKTGILKALASVNVLQVNNVAATAAEGAEKPGNYLLDQYSHRSNLLAHELYTGPEVVRVLGDKLSVIAGAMGSGGTIGGVGRFLKNWSSKTVVLGVRPAPGEQVPGARNKKGMDEVVTLPWERSVDAVIEVSRKESFIRMRRLWSGVEPQPGPTSGLAWGGLEHYLESLGPQKLEGLRGKVAAFICPDDGRFYSERTTGELDPDQGL